MYYLRADVFQLRLEQNDSAITPPDLSTWLEFRVRKAAWYVLELNRGPSLVVGRGAVLPSSVLREISPNIAVIKTSRLC